MAKAPKAADHPQLVTANDLRSGDVVFLTEAAGWSRRIAEAALAKGDAAASLLARAEADAKANIVVAPYLVPVTLEEGRPVPLQFRERIRAEGPSVPPVTGAAA